ncbi:MAG: glycerol kinase GlpK [Lachnospiraceae bacterium]|nr:glycerol kinase GlpK [Lachnospiraceae bacterium]MBP5185072.1 glycerol kinase GlpK [Lachnospiraceae bacterium]
MSKRQYVMALDQGTTSSRCIIFSKEGEIKSIAQKEFTQIYPKPGWVEHDPNEIWASQISVAAEAMAKFGLEAENIHAIGITNQRETTIVWDKNTGRPVYNAIVWQCRRTADEIKKIQGTPLWDSIVKKTGLIPDAYFSASKIAWILDNVPNARKAAETGNLLFGTVDTWLIWKLTEGRVHVTDYTNASRTMLFDIHRLCWDDEILDYFNIPRTMLPEVKPSSCIYGYTADGLLGAKIPIAGAAGDQQAALFGQCCFEPGDVKNTYGTGCFLLMNTGTTPFSSSNGLLTTIAASAGEKVEYALEGSVFIAGASVQWLRDELRMIKDAPQSEEYATAVPDTNGVYVVPAFAGLGAPYWDSYARGMIVGLTRGAKKEHIIRATLESIAFQTADVLHAMEQDAGKKLTSLKVDGGASANNFLVQFQADLLDAVVERPACVETTALGAAYLAGLATGYWTSKEEIKENWILGKRFEPRDTMDREKALKGWHKAVKCAQIFGEE